MLRCTAVAYILLSTASAYYNPPCDAPLRPHSPNLKCEGLYPTIFNQAGGERAIVAISNIDIPWYVKSQFDPCPWNKGVWLSSVGKPRDWENWMALPKLKISSEGKFAYIDADNFELKVLNRTWDPVEFRDFLHVTPERNAELLRMHKDHTLITFKMPATPSGVSGRYELFLVWDNTEVKLTSSHATAPCDVYLHDNPLRMSDVYPEMLPAHGGTTITVMGSFYTSWKQQQPKAKFVDHHGLALYTSATYLDPYRVEFVSPPMVLNETDITINTTMYLSFSWQTWYPVQLNGNVTVPIVYYDESRIVCGQTIALERASGLRTASSMASPLTFTSKGSPHTVLSVTNQIHRVGSRNFQPVKAVDKLSTDTSLFWTVKEAHGQSPCTPGMPIMCNQTIRLTSLSTGRNLHASWADAPLKTHEVSAYGENGHGNAADDWMIRCEPNTIHPYHRSLYDKQMKISDLGERVIQNFTWGAFEFDVPFHEARFKWILEQNDKYWRPSTVFSLIHGGTQRYLSVINRTMPSRSCGGGNNGVCDNANDYIVATVKHAFNAGEPPRRESIRLFSSAVIDVPVDCGGDESRRNKGFRTRFMRHTRRIKEGDFVVWQPHSLDPCSAQGKLHQDLVDPLRPASYIHCTSCSYLVGQVNQIFRHASALMVEVWEQRYPLTNSFMPSEAPQYQQTIQRRNVTLMISAVYGPLVHKLDGTSAGPAPPPAPPPPAKVPGSNVVGDWMIDPITGQWVQPQIQTDEVDTPDAVVLNWRDSRRNTMDILSPIPIKFRQYVKLRVERMPEYQEAYQEQMYREFET